MYSTGVGGPQFDPASEIYKQEEELSNDLMQQLVENLSKTVDHLSGYSTKVLSQIKATLQPDERTDIQELLDLALLERDWQQDISLEPLDTALLDQIEQEIKEEDSKNPIPHHSPKPQDLNAAKQRLLHAKKSKEQFLKTLIAYSRLLRRGAKTILAKIYAGIRQAEGLRIAKERHEI